MDLHWRDGLSLSNKLYNVKPRLPAMSLVHWSCNPVVYVYIWAPLYSPDAGMRAFQDDNQTRI